MNDDNKPTVYISTQATNLTNQANVAAKLFDRVSDKAGREVWNAHPDDWMITAEIYVNLKWWDLYGTRWEAPDMPLSPLTAYAPVPALDHHTFPVNLPVSEAAGALAKIKRFLGFRDKKKEEADREAERQAFKAQAYARRAADQAKVAEEAAKEARKYL